MECERLENERILCRQFAGNDEKNSKQLKNTFSNNSLLTPNEYKELSVIMDETNFSEFLRGKGNDHNTYFNEYNNMNKNNKYNSQISNVRLSIFNFF